MFILIHNKKTINLILELIIINNKIEIIVISLILLLPVKMKKINMLLTMYKNLIPYNYQYNRLISLVLIIIIIIKFILIMLTTMLIIIITLIIKLIIIPIITLIVILWRNLIIPWVRVNQVVSQANIIAIISQIVTINRTMT